MTSESPPDLKNQPDDVKAAHQHALSKCRPLKDRYDQCFNGWYRHAFLQGRTGGNNCDDFFDEYRACLIEVVHEKGLSHLAIFGPPPESKDMS